MPKTRRIRFIAAALLSGAVLGGGLGSYVVYAQSISASPNPGLSSDTVTWNYACPSDTPDGQYGVPGSGKQELVGNNGYGQINGPHIGSFTWNPGITSPLTFNCYANSGVYSTNITWTLAYSQSAYYSQSGYYSQAGYYSQSSYGPTQPDLTAGAVSPTTATAGTAATFSSTISNSGTATGASFVSLLQKANDSSGTGATDAASTTVSAIGAGGTGTASFPYTFPTTDGASTKYLRVCADKASAAGTGTITESNESNNCSAWTAITVAAAASAPTVSLAASPTSVVSGSSATLTWSSSGATTCTGTNFSTGNATSGSVSTGALSSTQNYSVSCTGVGGTNAAVASVTVTAAPSGNGIRSLSRTYNTAGNYGMTVVATDGSGNSVSANCSTYAAASCSGAASAVLTAFPSRVTVGNTTTLTLTTTNVLSGSTCTITGSNGFSTTTSPTSCNYVSPQISTTANNAQTVYTATCSGATATTVVVNVLPRFREF